MITRSDLNQIEKYADRLFAAVGIDVEFTRHFMDRVNDTRNKAQITSSELIRLFKQSFKRYGKKIAQLGPDAQAVINDMKTDINIPFVLNLKGNELELVAKTVMRKKDFRTSGPKLSFEQFSNRSPFVLLEDKGGKNLHLEHLEDEILNYGVDGGRAAINFLRSLRDMLAGASRSSVNMTVKWDGAPAIFAGIDPEDDKFFIGKKSVFNKPGAKLYKSQVGKTFQRINAGQLRSFLKLQESMTGALVGASLKTYNNSKVRAGEKVSNPMAHAKGYEKWVWDTVQKQIDKAKSEKGKDKYRNVQKEYTREVKKHTANLKQIITFQNLLVDAKMQIVQKLNSVKGLTDTFIKTANGFKVTNPEGYVAIDRVSGGAVKLVDRMEFSFNNFTAIKAWDK